MLVYGSMILVSTLLAFTSSSSIERERTANTHLARSDAATRIAEHLREREYHFSPAEGGAWTAPNRAHNLRTVVSWDGVEVVSRTDGAAGLRLKLRLVAYGREGGLEPVPGASPLAWENRVEAARAGIVEWYVNDSRGLEQGFDLDWPPGGGDGSGRVVLEMALETELAPRLTDEGRSVEVRRGGGLALLRYGGLSVVDATGRSLPARLAVSAAEIRIEIDDQDAVYPLVVDPLMENPAWETESNQVGATFGSTAITAGDVNGDGYDDVIVGSDWWDNGQNDEGGAWVWHGSAAGLAGGPMAALEDANWSAEGDQADASFGMHAASAGDVNGDG